MSLSTETVPVDELAKPWQRLEGKEGCVISWKLYLTPFALVQFNYAILFFFPNLMAYRRLLSLWEKSTPAESIILGSQFLYSTTYPFTKLIHQAGGDQLVCKGQRYYQTILIFDFPDCNY